LFLLTGMTCRKGVGREQRRETLVAEATSPGLQCVLSPKLQVETARLMAAQRMPEGKPSSESK